MEETYEITIRQDLDGFLGNDSESIAKLDIEKSQANYEKMIRKEIKKIYPNLIVNIEWGNVVSKNYLFGDFPMEEQENFQWELEGITERIYNTQEFWVEK
jgi:hypothetical protein